MVVFGQVKQSHCHSLLEQVGSPTRSQLCLLTRSFGNGADFSTCRVSGREGQCFLADWESGLHNSGIWQLLPTNYQLLVGLSTIDLFMSRMYNAQLSVYRQLQT